jgi:hypothetical protein
MVGDMMRYGMLALAIGSLAYFHVTVALALGNGDVAVVAELLEELSPERGESIYYDEEAADDWYEYDQENEGLIAAAGLSRGEWRDTYDKVLKGLIALIPSAEFDAIHSGLKERVDALQGLSEQEKQRLMQEMMSRQQTMKALRSEGEAYVDAVRPFSRRLRALGRF